MLKFTYEKETDVPEAHKALYEQKEIELTTAGGKVKLWVLGVEDVVPKARFVEFRDGNKTLAAENKALKEKYDGIDDADKAKALLKYAKDVEIDEAEKYLKKGGVEGMVVERTKAMKEEYDKKLVEANNRATAVQGQLDRYKIDTAVLTAASKLPLQEGADVFLLQLARDVFKVVNGEIVAVDKDGKELYSATDASSKLSVSEWIEIQPKKHSFLFKDSQGAGSAGGGHGSGGTGGAGANGNPWKKETWNKTEQQAVYRKDQALASRLAKAAGVDMFASLPKG